MPNNIDAIQMVPPQNNVENNEKKNDEKNLALLILTTSMLGGATENAKGSMGATAPKGDSSSGSSSTSTITQQLDQDLATYQKVEEELFSMKMEIAKLLEELKKSKNPLLAAQMLMLAVQGYKGEQMAGFAAVSNIDSDLRNAVNEATSGFNAVTLSGAQQFMDSLDAIQDFMNNPEVSKIVGSSTMDSIKSSIEDIKTTFGPWNPDQVLAQIRGWESSNSSGKYAPQITNIQGGLGSLNQTFSSQSTSTMTNLQFQGKMYQQIMSEVSGGFQMIVGLLKTMVSNERTQ